MLEWLVEVFLKIIGGDLVVLFGVLEMFVDMLLEIVKVFV